MPYRRKGSGFWYIVDRNGKRVSSGTSSRKDAEALEAKERHERWLTERMGAKTSRSWEEACAMWYSEKKHKQAITEDLRKLKWFDPYLGKIKDLNHITRELIHEVILNRPVSLTTPCKANNTANTYVQVVQSILNAAERDWEWGNRAPKLRRYPSLKTEARWLTVEEWNRLSAELPDYLKLVATFSVCTGVRKEKAFGLRWQNIKMEERCFTVTGMGKKNGVSAPLNRNAIQVLEKCRSAPIVHHDRVFLFQGRPFTRYEKSWYGAFERSGVPYMKWHGLRATFNQWLANEKVPREIRMRLLGHHGTEAHDAYLNYGIEDLRPYVEVIDRLLSTNSAQRAVVTPIKSA